MIIDDLVKILESFEYEVVRQGSYSSLADYPDTFITYWNPASPEHSHYDNANYGIEWNIDVYVYSTSIDTIYELTKEIRDALKTDGWIIDSAGFDIDSDSPTHSGRGLEIKKIIYKEEEDNE